MTNEHIELLKKRWTTIATLHLVGRKIVGVRYMTAAEQHFTSPDAADQALEAVSTRKVLELIASLPGDQAEIIMLRVVAGLEAREVARIVGKSPGAVRVAAHRGLRKLAGMAFNLRAGIERPANLDSLFDHRPFFDESDTVLDPIDDDRPFGEPA